MTVTVQSMSSELLIKGYLDSDSLVVSMMQLGTGDYILTAIELMSKDNLVKDKFLRTNTIGTSLHALLSGSKTQGVPLHH